MSFCERPSASAESRSKEDRCFLIDASSAFRVALRLVRLLRSRVLMTTQGLQSGFAEMRRLVFSEGSSPSTGGSVWLCRMLGIRERIFVPPVNWDPLFDEPRTLVSTREGFAVCNSAQTALRDLRPLETVLLFPVANTKLTRERLGASRLPGSIGSHDPARTRYARTQTCATGKTLRLVIWQDSCERKMPARPLPLRAKEPKRPPGIPDGLWYFPRNLADHANARGLSQKQIAAMAGVKQSSVSRWLAYEIASLPIRYVMALEEGMGLEHGVLTRPPAPFQVGRRSAL